MALTGQPLRITGWDTVMLVLVNADRDATEISETDRPAVTAELITLGSKAWNERGAPDLHYLSQCGIVKC